jgi:hypothetical protein
MTARWLYFEIPYAQDANLMRALFGYTDAEGSLATEIFYPCRDIPEAIQKMEACCKEKSISIDRTLVYVDPLDMRHGLAGVVRELADKHERDFSRHIPGIYYPPHNQRLLYSPFNDGSSEMNLDKPGAIDRVVELETEAVEEYGQGDMLTVLGGLRHALRLSVIHLGWNSPHTLRVLFNVQKACRATGSQENIFEANFLLFQFTSALLDHATPKSHWESHRELSEKVAAFLEQEGEVALATIFRGAFLV